MRFESYWKCSLFRLIHRGYRRLSGVKVDSQAFIRHNLAMSESNSDPNQVDSGAQATPAENTSASPVTPPNQVAPESQASATTTPASSTPASVAQSITSSPATPQSTEVAWPDAQPATTNAATQSAPNQPTTTESSSSRTKMIAGLLVLLVVLIGVYVVLRVL